MSKQQYPWCGRCGSRNHKEYDCTTTGQYVPTATDLASLQEDPGPAPEPGIAAKVQVASVPEPVFEVKPRWPGAPLLCTAANLFSFADEAGVAKWRARNCLHGSVRRVWECKDCGGVHYESVPMQENGTQKAAAPDWWNGRIKFRKAIRGSSFHEAHAELPKHEPLTDEAAKKALPAAGKRGKVGKEQSLF